MNRVFKDGVPVLYKCFHNLVCPLMYSFPMLPRYASNYKVTQLAQRKPEPPLITYQYHVEVPQRKMKETRLTGELYLHNAASFMRRNGFKSRSRHGSLCAFILCCSACRHRPCDGLIPRPSPTACVGIKKLKKRPRSTRAVEP
jgi:hypothetical protein